MLVEMDVGGATKGATMQDSQDSMRLAGCNSSRGTRVLHQCRMAQRGVQRCEMHRVVATAERPEREHLLVIVGASTSGVFLA